LAREILKYFSGVLYGRKIWVDISGEYILGNGLGEIILDISEEQY